MTAQRASRARRRATWCRELTPERVLDSTRGLETTMTLLQCLMRMSYHWAYHTGQIVFVTKMLRAGSVSDLFRRTMVK